MWKRIVDMDVVNDVTRYYTCGHTIFMTRRYPLNNSDVIMIKLFNITLNSVDIAQ